MPSEESIVGLGPGRLDHMVELPSELCKSLEMVTSDPGAHFYTAEGDSTAVKGSPESTSTGTGSSACMLEMPLVHWLTEEDVDQGWESESQTIMQQQIKGIRDDEAPVFHTMAETSTHRVAATILSDVQEVLEAACGNQWHVVCAIDARANRSMYDVPGGARTQMLRRQVPRDATAILVLCEVKDIDQASEVIKDMTEDDEERLPVIAVLMRGTAASRPSGWAQEHHRQCMTTVLMAEDCLSAAGADDVILKGSGPEGLRTDIHISIARARRQLEKRMKYEQELQRKAMRIEELQYAMWTTVQRIVPGFPKMEPEGSANLMNLMPGAKVGHCILGQALGAGGAGKVFFARNHIAGRDEAVKAFKKKSITSVEWAMRISNEVHVLGKLKHCNIPKLHSFLHTADMLYIHMEFSGRRSLYDGIDMAGGWLDVESTQIVTSQVASALGYCHGQGIAHCDVKPENIVLADGSPRAQLVDFGAAVKTNTTLTGFRGTMPFMAPEVLSGDPYKPAPTDAWSLGVVLLEMLCGTHKLSRVLGLDKKMARPEHWLYEEMITLFRRPEVIRALLEPDDVVPSPDLLFLLNGVLDVSPLTRWTPAHVLNSVWLSAAPAL